MFNLYLVSIQDEVFGKEFTKVVPLKVLWETGWFYIGILGLEDRKEVVEVFQTK